MTEYLCEEVIWERYKNILKLNRKLNKEIKREKNYRKKVKIILFLFYKKHGKNISDSLRSQEKYLKHKQFSSQQFSLDSKAQNVLSNQ